MRFRVTVACALALGFAAGAGAQIVSTTQFFPIVARNAGAGVPPTQWVTDLVVHNLTMYTLVAGLQFYPEKQANSFNESFPVRITLRPRETVILEDVLSTKFGYSQDIKGSLLVTCSLELFPTSGNPWDGFILATTRTYNVGSPVGTFGQTVPSLPPLANGYASQSFVTGARNDDQFRSNLGIVNLSFEPITVHYRIMVGNAILLAQGSKAMNPLSVGQWSFSSLGVGKVAGPMTVDLWMDPSDVTDDPCEADWPNQFMAYVAKVDGNPNGTGDGEFMYAAPNEIMDCEGLWW